MPASGHTHLHLLAQFHGLAHALEAIALLSPLAYLFRHHQERGGDVAHKEQKEEPAHDGHMPGGVGRIVGQLEERPGIVRLKGVANEQEWQKEAQAAPHPRMEALNGDIHVVAFAQRLEPIQQTLLIAKLQILHDACAKRKRNQLIHPQISTAIYAYISLAFTH